MKYRELGQTGMKVSTVAFGCWAFAGGGVWGDQEDSEAVAAIHRARELGINFFDTAQGYGRSEEILGEALGVDRKDAIIATKVSRGDLSEASIFENCEISLKRLKTDYIDLYQVHWPRRKVAIAETVGALEELIRQGKIRAAGVSNFGPLDMAEYLEYGKPVTNQLPYSLLFRAIEYEIQPQCVENAIGILCYSSLMQGLLTGKFKTPDDVPEGRARTRLFSSRRPRVRHGEDGCEADAFEAIAGLLELSGRIGLSPETVALAWLLKRPAVVSVLVSIRNPAQAEKNAPAADLTLDDELIGELDEIFEPVKKKLGKNPDMWESESRYR